MSFTPGPGATRPSDCRSPRASTGWSRSRGPTEPLAAAPPRLWLRYAGVGIAVLVLLNLAAWVAFWTTHGTERILAQVQASAPWAPLLKAEPPTLLVLGDYYIFGEIDERAGINRLVREYGINSREDLDAWLMDTPRAMGTYRDLDLYYLPVGAAFALRSIVPIVSRGAAKAEDLHVVMASDLTPEMLKRNNIVYLGYLSGLGVLRAPVFAASRFSIGETYDELVDAKTHVSYASQEGGPSQGDATRRDYGYITAFRGPAGNRIVIIAGARDTGLMQAAEALASPGALKAMAKAAGGGDSFEALYEAEGIGRSSLGGRLVVAAPRSAVNPWTEPSHQTFPAG